MHLPQSMSWLVFSACSAIAEELAVPEVSALLCSLRQCSKVRPVWPLNCSRRYTTGGVNNLGIGVHNCAPGNEAGVKCDGIT